MPTPSTHTQKHLVIQTKIEQLSLVEDFIDEIHQEHHFREDVYGNILISVTEAVNNAILHGNQNDGSKKIEVSCSFITDYLVSFVVTDEGEGFDFKCIKDPTSPENLLDEHGRGVFVMLHLADEVIYKERGNVVELRFSV
ncbi:MAG: ATP-binding protein [Bacteroidetes bacterium]|nr:ATP-binding protein [Bacteroidota bacterium]